MKVLGIISRTAVNTLVIMQVFKVSPTVVPSWLLAVRLQPDKPSQVAS